MNNFSLAIVIFLVFAGSSFIVDYLLRNFATRFDASSSEIFRIVSNSQKAILFFVGAVLGLDKLGFDVSTLVAGLGLTGFAMGLALKDAISNLVAGVLIVLYKTIELDDVIEISGTQGKVIDVNLRYITIKSEDKEHLVPNSLFLNSKIAILEKGFA